MDCWCEKTSLYELGMCLACAHCGCSLGAQVPLASWGGQASQLSGLGHGNQLPRRREGGRQRAARPTRVASPLPPTPSETPAALSFPPVLLRELRDPPCLPHHPASFPLPAQNPPPPVLPRPVHVPGAPGSLLAPPALAAVARLGTLLAAFCDAISQVALWNCEFWPGSPLGLVRRDCGSGCYPALDFGRHSQASSAGGGGLKRHVVSPLKWPLPAIAAWWPAGRCAEASPSHCRPP